MFSFRSIRVVLTALTSAAALVPTPPPFRQSAKNMRPSRCGPMLRALNNGWVLGRRAIRGGGEGQCKAHAGEIAGDENKLNDYGNTTLKRVPELE